MAGLLLVALGLLAGAGGVLLLRRTWRRPEKGARQGALIVAGWALVAACFALLMLEGGFDRGATIALCVVGFAAYIAIAFGIEIRRPKKPAREPVAAAEPIDPRPRPLRLARATARFLLAVVPAATAAIALVAAWAIKGPGVPVDRLVVGAYVLPLLWGAGMTWALSDDKLLRPTIGLIGCTALGAAIAFVPGVS